MAKHRVLEFDKMRFKYEYGGMSVRDLCRASGHSIDDVTEYAEMWNWQVYEEPDPNDKNKSAEVDEFYLTVRRKLTLAVSRRALVMWDRLCEIEDYLIDKTIHILEGASANPNAIPLDALELTRLAKVLQILQTSNKIYAEAVDIPALVDKSQKGVLGDDDFNSMAEKIRNAVQKFDGSLLAPPKA